MRFNHVAPTIPRILLSVAFVAWCGCATTKPRHQWTEEALQAETAQYEGDLDRAEGRYRELMSEAPDEDRRRWLQYNLATVARDRGETEEALRRFEVVWSEDLRDLHGANAMYEASKLYDGERSVEMRLDVARRYPDQVSAEFAVQEIVSEYLRSDREQELEALLEGLVADVDDTELEDNLWFELARLRSEYLDDHNGALQAYRSLYEEYGKGALGDDALWEMANIYRAHQMWQPALTLLAKLADEVESSWFIGDYESDWVDDAIYDAGWINLVFVGDYEAAEKWLKRYLKDFPEGLLSDDAAWHLAELERLRGNDAAYRAALRDFVDDYPESRFVRNARARLGGAS